VRRALVLCLLLTSVGMAHAAGPPPQWLPQQSWPGGRQDDARLERTVKYWGTGVPAADLFGAITRQTGVQLGFSPPDDDNARICLNVYLNPKEPPTLRDMLVQIGWVMDCAWGVEGEGEQSRYVLLHTNSGDGVVESVQAQAAARARQQAAGARRQAAVRWQRVEARLEEMRAALCLSRGEAIAGYRGRDDAMLVALIDPARRALLQFLLSVQDETGAEEARLGPGHGLHRSWSQLDEEQRALVRAALQPLSSALSRDALARPPEWDAEWEELAKWGLRWDDWKALEARDLEVVADLDADGGQVRFRVDFTVEKTADGPRTIRRGSAVVAPSLYLLPTEGNLPFLQVAARRALGEEVSREEESHVWDEYSAAGDREQRQRRADAQLSRLAALSPKAAHELSSLLLPMERDQEYSLWQVQEAVAALSGRHVISDHFWQPPRDLAETLGSPDADEPPSLDARRALQALTVPVVDDPLDARIMLISDSAESGRSWMSWEWGDAGAFLRFRSSERDVWRSALLPEPVIRAVSELTAPYVAAGVEAEGEARPHTAQLAFDPRWYGALLGPLTIPQAEAGPLIAHGNPGDLSSAYEQAFWEQVMSANGELSDICRLLGVLSEDEWQQLSREGLSLGKTVALDRVPPSARYLRDSWPVHAGDRMDIVREVPAGRPRVSWTDTTDSLWLRYTRWHGEVQYYQLPLVLTLRPRHPQPHLVSPASVP
jgi:hypothetical protein